MAKIPYGDYYYISSDEYDALYSILGQNYGGLPGYTVQNGSSQTPAGYYIPVDEVDTPDEENALWSLSSFEFRPVFESVQGVYSPYPYSNP